MIKYDMIIFLHGPDSFRSRAKLNLMIGQFKKTRDPRGDNVVRLEGNKTSIDEINSKLASRSLLAEKRMIIVYDLFSHKEKNIFQTLLEYLKKIEKEKNDNVIIFYEGKELDGKKYEDKKMSADQKKLFNYLAKQTFSEKFSLLNILELQKWIMKKTTANKIQMTPNTANLIINLAGRDLWNIGNELNKLINFVQARKKNIIEEKDVRQFLREQLDENIFALTDAISNKNKALFFNLLEGQIESGTSAQQIMAMLVRQFKIILQIKELLIKNSAQQNIATELKLHPFVVKKTIPQTRNFSLDYLKQTLNQLVDIDYKIKTGQADSLTSLNLLFAN